MRIAPITLGASPKPLRLLECREQKWRGSVTWESEALVGSTEVSTLCQVSLLTCRASIRDPTKFALRGIESIFNIPCLSQVISRIRLVSY